MIKVLVVDDEPAVRRGLCMRLSAEPDVTIVGEAVDEQGAADLAHRLGADVVLIDAEMQCPDRYALITNVRANAPRSAVVVLSLHDDAVFQKRALAAGVAAFVGKQGSVGDLLTAIRRVKADLTSP